MDDRTTLSEIELVAEVPRTMADALGAEMTEPHHTVASYGGVGSEGSPKRNSSLI